MVKDIEPVYIISDNPERKKVSFGYDADARSIADLIANKKNLTPMVIGIYGPWGSGKTTLMEIVKRLLSKDKRYKKSDRFRTCKPVWFQAWKYREENEILAALIEVILNTMKQDGFLESCRAEVESLIERFQPFKIVKHVSEKLTGIDITEFFSELKHREKLGYYHAFNEFFERLIWTYLNWQPKISASDQVDDQKGALAIFIDDLDRCPKDRIKKVLETVKLFMDKPGCIFIIGAANEIVEEALRETYGDDAHKFMDKVVQVAFHLPMIPNEAFSEFVYRISPTAKDEILPQLPLIIQAMENNPRRLKRFLNNLSLREGVFRNRGLDLEYKHLLFWSIIEYVYPSLQKDLWENPSILSILREKITVIETRLKDREAWEVSEENLEGVPQSLHQILRDKKVVDILRRFDAETDQVRQLVSLSKMIVTPEKPDISRIERAPEAMVKIPAGIFLYGDEKKEEKIETPFFIDVYPVTNRQYEQFIKAGGYENEQYWTKEGIGWRNEGPKTKPEYWDNNKWNQPEFPVIGVCLYEAEAYAAWAGKRLPTELEWERAARWTDGREYPWGDEFDTEKCNVSESGIGQTTRVTRYPNGISKDGCYDMAGNVWEWTSSFYDDDKQNHVLRGGSWGIGADGCRCAYRFDLSPDFRSRLVGFRCARTVTL
jgi:iron(II)-dependent oxidoreductase